MERPDLLRNAQRILTQSSKRNSESDNLNQSIRESQNHRMIDRRLVRKRRTDLKIALLWLWTRRTHFLRNGRPTVGKPTVHRST